MFIDKIFTCVMYRQQEHQVIVTYTYVYSHTGKYILVYNTIQLHVCTPNYLLAQELYLLALLTSVFYSTMCKKPASIIT